VARSKTMSYYDEIFTRLNKVNSIDEVVAIRDEAEVARIKARLASDLQTETLAADIVERACQKLLKFDGQHKGLRGQRRGKSWIPLHSLGRHRR
jgi:hypothetical protein